MMHSAGPFLLITGATIAPSIQAQAQLPFDPSMVDQLTPEQRQKALESIGQTGTPSSSSDGSFRDADSSTHSAQSGTDKRDSFGVGGRSSRDERTASRGSSRNAQDADGPRAGDGDVKTPGEAGKSLKPFGYDLFASSPSTFAPATDIPVPSDYVLGPGDNVRVQLFGNENANYSLQVSRDGKINFPKLGPIAVAGQRFEDMKTALEDRVGREMIGVQASISLGELRSIRIFLLGDVNQPGSYTVSSLSTITNALFVGGGIDKVGSLRRVQLKRAGTVIRTFDLYDLLLRGDSSSDLRLLPGDVVFVPPAGARVSVDGEVKRPAIYELNGERSVGQILQLAGGIPASANTSTAQVERYDQRQKKVLLQLDVGKASDLAYPVQDGDLVRVRQIAQGIENNVRVIGYVKYPGFYQWSDGYRLRALLQAAQIKPSDANQESYLAIGLVERTNTASGVRDWISFNVDAVLNGNAAAFPLQRDDLVVILNRGDVGFLDSAEVRSVVGGDLSGTAQCPALKTLATVVNSERAIRFLKTFTAENLRSAGQAKTSDVVKKAGESVLLKNGQDSNGGGDNAQGNYAYGANLQANQQRVERVQTRAARDDDQTCPAIFQQAPRALPYLLERSVAVYGEVRRPGIYPIAADTPLQTLVESAGGLSAESDSGNIEFISYGEALKTGRSSYQTLSLKLAGGGDQPINPGDVLNFKPLYLGQEVGTVKLAGEFRFPGSYGILRGEHLSQLLGRAGGVTQNSYPYGAVFTRISAREAEKQSYQRAATDLQEAMVTAVTSGALTKDSSATSAQLLTTVIQRLQTQEPVGRVVIEADPTILQARPEQDLLLEPGDALYMPKRPISVTVSGQVLNPGSLAFVPGGSFKRYIDQAGGYTQGADAGRAFVILPNGTAQGVNASFWDYKSQDIPPGSLIVVPRDAAPFNIYAFSERFFGILSNLAISAAALVTINNANK